MLHVCLLVELGDAMEDQGDRGRARQYDRQAWSLWAPCKGKFVDGTIASALRREGLDLLKRGKPMEAVARLENARHFYIDSLETGIHFMYISGLMSTMAAVKV